MSGKTAVLETTTTDIFWKKSIYIFDAEVSLAVAAEQIDGKDLLIRKFRIGVFTESLIVKT